MYFRNYAMFDYDICLLFQGLVDFVIDEINLSTVTHFNLLEVGCGSGAISLALLHAHRKGKVKKKMDIVAVDKNLDAVHLTEHNAKLNNMQDLKVPMLVYVQHIIFCIT